MNARPRAGRGTVVVCLSATVRRDLLGELPANVEVVLLPPEGHELPDLSQVGFIVPNTSSTSAILDGLARMERLRVIQTLSAGVDWLAGRVPAGVIVCNARGVYDGPLAEWVLGAILAMQRGLVQARDAQRAAAWRPFEPGELAGRRVVILGLGSIGTAVAARLRPFGVEVVGVTRTGRDGVVGLDDLAAVLPRADIVVDLLPLTRDTVGLLDDRLLGSLPDGALVVNAGRGRTIDTPALVRELASGRLRAALDVTDPEPLPADHPLWVLPNVLLSPHIAGDSPDSTARAAALAGDQIRRFAAGEPLLNEVAPYLLA